MWCFGLVSDWDPKGPWNRTDSAAAVQKSTKIERVMVQMPTLQIHPGAGDVADTDCFWCLEVGIISCSVNGEDAASSGSATSAWGHGSSELHLLCQIWERSERLETKINQMSWSQSILVRTVTSSFPCQTLVESPDPTGNAEGSWLCIVGDTPAHPHSSALTPCVSSCAQLCFTSPGKPGREKTGNRCCVNLCSINFDSDFHPLGSAAAA